MENALLFGAPVLQAVVMAYIKDKLLKGQGKCWQIRLIATCISLLLTAAGYCILPAGTSPAVMVYLALWIYCAQYMIDMDLIKKALNKKAVK